MRLRISSAVFGGTIILATIILLYQVINLPSEGKFPLENSKAEFLEKRIQHLESDIKHNQETLLEIKKLLKYISQNDNLNDILIPEDIPRQVNNKFDRNLGDDLNNVVVEKLFSDVNERIIIPKGNCSFRQFLPSVVDIRMKDVYKLLPFDNPNGGAWKQGWEIQYDPLQWSPEKKLKVFVVPHSHNDPGWIKTFERYFADQTKHILDNMVQKMSEDSRKKFIWAETSYFALWWENLSLDLKEATKRLVQNGQLEIVSGGWVMPDEANSHYWALVEQLILGHEWLGLHLGVKPTNSWSIDPFGVSPTMAYLLRRSGFQNMLVQRTHYSIKKHFAQEKNLEFKWRQIWDTGSSTDILCHMMPFYSYDIPHTCGPDPKMCCQFDFKRLPGSGVICPWKIQPQPISSLNLETRSKILLEQYRKKAQLFRTNVVLVPLGDDFRYDRPNEWDDQFYNYYKLFDYMNSRVDWNVEASFGTLNDYFKAVRDESKHRVGEQEGLFPTLTGDFFTYSDRDDHYWSGYYTSRPFHKALSRTLESYLRSAEILFSLLLGLKESGWFRDNMDFIHSMSSELAHARMAVGLFQHHDGITGTGKNHVMVDYAKKMVNGIHSCQAVISSTSQYLLSEKEAVKDLHLSETFRAHNVLPSYRLLKSSSGNEKKIVVYNSHGHRKKTLITVRISECNVQVTDEEGRQLHCQIDPVLSLTGQMLTDEYSLSFVVDLKPLSLTVYTVTFLQQPDMSFAKYAAVTVSNQIQPELPSVFRVSKRTITEGFSVKGSTGKAHFSSNGLLEKIADEQGRETETSLSFVRYGAKSGKEMSGAYLFLPDGPAVTLPVHYPPVIVMHGPLQSSVYVRLKHLLHRVTLSSAAGLDSVGINIENYVNISQESNFELAMRLNTDIESGSRFFTDLNGFQITERTRFTKVKLQGNYYPMPSQVFIEDHLKRLSLLGGQPLGCSSLKSGELEVMFDRRLMQDDNRGLGHGVTDTLLTHNSFKLLVEYRLDKGPLLEDTGTAFPSLVSILSLNNLLYPPIVMYSDSMGKVNGAKHSWSVGGQGLPCDVHLVALRVMLTSPQPGSPFPPSSTAALILHRQGFDCSWPSYSMSCHLSAGKMQIRELLPKIFSPNIHRMSLSMMHTNGEITSSHNLSLQPMELYAFKLYLDVT